MKTSTTTSLLETAKVVLVVVAMGLILNSVDVENTKPANTAAQQIQGSQLLTLNK